LVRYRIKDWNRLYETSESRKLKALAWVSIPNSMTTQGYTALLDHPNGAAHFGAWVALVEICSARKPREMRGVIPESDGTIAGISRCLGRISRISSSIFCELLPRLLNDPDILWIEQIPEHQQNLPEHQQNLPASPGVPGIHNITEHNITEHNTHTTVRASRAADLSGVISQRFEEFWELYPRKQRKDEACHWWISLVTTSVETAAIACLRRYIASDEVSRGVVANPAKWLQEQARDAWGGTWPTTRNGATRPKTALDELLEEAR
jgi:hypothetical protein